MDAAAKRALEQAVEHGAYDPVFWLRFFLPHWFPSEIPAFHVGLAALQTKQVEFLNDYPQHHEFLLNEFKYKADPLDPTSSDLPVFRLLDGKIYMVSGEHDNWLIPRGFSKTTLTNGLNLRDITVDGTKFIVYLSKSAEHAQMQLGNIRAELEGNELLRAAYGDVVPTRKDLEKWAADQLQLRNGGILVARGRGGQVRGLNFRARRPNKIVLDDVEDDNTAVKSPTLRQETEKWFYSDVEKAGQLMEGMVGQEGAQEPLHIVNLGTLLGPECLMMTLAKDPKFNTVQFGARLNYDDPNDQRMLWPFKLSYETYAKDRVRHQRVGKLAEFTRELDSRIRVDDDSIFPSKFIYQPVLRTELTQVAIALDPAISERKKADHAAIIVAGRREKDGAIWVLEEWGGQGKTPTELIEKFFELHLKWQCTHAGIESQQYQKSLLFILREYMARKQYFFPVKGIIQGADDSKIARIQGMLSPRYMNGIIRHLRPMPLLEGNLTDWPNGKRDYADAATMALQLLGETQMLVLPEGMDERPVGEDYKPQQEVLPPVYTVASNHIIHSADPYKGRYG